MTSEDNNHHHHHPTSEGTGAYRLSSPCNRPTNQNRPHHHRPSSLSQNFSFHGNPSRTKDDTDEGTLRQIGQQLAEIGDEVNVRYTMFNRFIDLFWGSIRFMFTLQLFPFVRITFEMIIRKPPLNNRYSHRR